MKTITLLLISFISLWAAVPALVTDPDPAGLNVRSSPGGEVVGVLPSGKYGVVVSVDRVEGKWCHYKRVDLFDYSSGRRVQAENVPQSGYLFRKLIGLFITEDIGVETFDTDQYLTSEIHYIDSVWIDTLQGRDRVWVTAPEYKRSFEVLVEEIPYPFPNATYSGGLETALHAAPVRRDTLFIRDFNGKIREMFPIAECYSRFSPVITGAHGDMFHFSYVDNGTIEGVVDPCLRHEPAAPRDGYLKKSDVTITLRYSLSRNMDEHYVTLYTVPGRESSERVLRSGEFELIDVWFDWYKVKQKDLLGWVHRSDVWIEPWNSEY